LKEFIPISRVDPIYFEHGYYLAPDEGGEKAYRLLSDAMRQTGRMALAEMVSHNKENLVLIRPAQGGLILQSMFYKNEIRDFATVPKGQPERPTRAEFDLAASLLQRLSSDEFHPEAYSDLYRTQLLSLLDEKRKGHEVSISRPPPPRTGVVDLYAALKPSLEESKEPRPKQRARKKIRRLALPNYFPLVPS
jgi:DNA end-binding protein Ku